MAGHKLPPMVVRGLKERPLDLSVKKTDDDDGILSVSSQIVATNGNNQLMEVYQTAVKNSESAECRIDGLYPRQNSVSNCSNLNALSNSAILPKKRKNLWRPYDVSCFEMDRDLDSIMSDSSNSSQEQENTRDSMIMTCKMDPVKRRKLEILRYSCYEGNTSPGLAKKSKDGAESVAGFETVSASSDMSMNTNTQNDDDNEKSSSKFNPFYTPLFESRERLMSGLKKKDIFGLSFRIAPQPSFAFHHKEDNIVPSSKSEDSNIVCVDNNKTYFQLQTVRKSSTNTEQTNSCAQGSHFQSYGCPKEKTTQLNSSANLIICSLTKNSPGEALSSSQIGQKRFSTPIMKSNRAKDDNDKNDKNQIKHVTRVPSDASPNNTFCCTLRHLIQDIEEEEEDNSQSSSDISDKTARDIATLLQQCNSVKLTAIDLLMSSVNINGEERRYSPKSSRIQQMLKGEKPKMVNMLDIVELQVEVGIGI